MKLKVSKFKEHSFCNTGYPEAATRCSRKTSALKNSAIPTGKHWCQSLSAIDLQALRWQKETAKQVPYRVPRNSQEHSF